MNEPIVLLYILNLIFIGLLPKIFFRKDGRFNLMWWVTASPFIICAVFLILATTGSITPFRPDGWGRWLDLISIPFSVASIALLFFTLGTHRIPIALWHQDNDAPKHIVTYGAYRWIRHPFYASFILALLGGFIFCPHWGTLYTLLHGIIVLNLTAAREEKRLSASEFGDEYQQYILRTGRFWPRFKIATNGGGIREPR
jgi:protein-S-isoprenylcysteine O-methyltransferase Ste14